MEGQRGVLVTDVDPASFADDLGFGRGDVITEINHETVSSVEDYKKAVAKLKPGQNVVFKVLRRGDNEHTLTVFLPGVVPADGKIVSYDCGGPWYKVRAIGNGRHAMVLRRAVHLGLSLCVAAGLCVRECRGPRRVRRVEEEDIVFVELGSKTRKTSAEKAARSSGAAGPDSGSHYRDSDGAEQGRIVHRHAEREVGRLPPSRR